MREKVGFGEKFCKINLQRTQVIEAAQNRKKVMRDDLLSQVSGSNRKNSGKRGNCTVFIHSLFWEQ